MESRTERIVLETARHRIIGDLTMPREGYRSRLSEYLNRGEVDFIPLANVEVRPHDGGATSERAFIAVARTQIQLAYPADDRDDGLAPG